VSPVGEKRASPIWFVPPTRLKSPPTMTWPLVEAITCGPTEVVFPRVVALVFGYQCTKLPSRTSWPTR
jgi:hypothetical protein